MHKPEDIKELYQDVSEQTVEKFTIWADSVLFSWQWWIGVSLSIVPWILWIKYRRKESTLRLLSVGFFVMFISTLLDSIGVQLGLWYYLHAPLPLIPAFFPWDTTLMPVTVLAFLQFKPKINHYLKALLFAGLAAYIAEPFFTWINFYQPTGWRHIYSFTFYFIIYLISHKMFNGKSYRNFD
ncbi:CBO0543 family protein [Alkalihalobacillus deserti]|uniref:CBO0543 family protein n=1 Tax=Alkalihalobacillus deserti TaxID=2879466 RepID=UPI001D157087|nr:CBO0543 family protein [Alkalihalobacillus deserti]